MEKKFKRVLVLFLALLMLFGILPAVSAPALADNVITKIEIDGLVAPVAGEAVYYTGIAATSTPEGGTSYTDIRRWYYKDGLYKPYEESYYAANTDYMCTIKVKINEGFTAADLTKENVEVNAGEVITVTDFTNHIIVEVKFEKTGDAPDENCTISFDANNGTEETKEPITVKKLDPYTLPSGCDFFTPPEGKDFWMWEIYEGEEWKARRPAGDEIIVGSDITLKAQWRKLISHVDIYGVTPPEIGSKPSTEGIALVNASEAYIESIGWYLIEESTWEFLDSTATFEEGKVYRVSIVLKPNEGYGFQAGFSSAAVDGKPATEAYEQDGKWGTVWMTFPALYNYEVSFNPNGGEGDMAPVVVKNGSGCELPANGFTAPVGKKFKAWDVKGAEKQPGDWIVVTEDVEVKALWEDLTFTVTYQDEDGNAIGTPQIVIYGNDAVPEAFPDKAGFMGEWDHDGKNITEDKTIKPVYVEIKMTKEPPAWTQGSGKDAEFTSNAEFSDFVGVKVDDKDLDPANYDVKEGSIIVTLKAAYLKTLAPGKHKVEILSKTGSSVGHIEIKAATAFYAPSPKTGDSNDVFFWLEIALLSAAGLVLTYLEKKRRLKNNS